MVPSWLRLCAVLSLLAPAAALAAAAAPAPKKADDVASLQKKARARMQNLDFEQALPLLQQALKLPGLSAPKKADLQIDLGITLVNLGRNDDARQAFEDALALDSTVEPPVTAPPKIRTLFNNTREAKLNPPKPPPPVVEARVEPPPPKPAPAPAPAPAAQPVAAVEKPAQGRSIVLPIILEVVAAGALGAGIGTGVSSRSAANDLRAGLHTTAETDSLESRRKTMGAVSIVGYSVAGAAAVGGVIAFLVGGPSKPVAASATITPGGAQASVTVAF